MTSIIGTITKYIKGTIPKIISICIENPMCSININALIINVQNISKIKIGSSITL